MTNPKIALCLYGIIGGKKGKGGEGEVIDFRLCADHYKKYLLNNNNVDVFFHTWSAKYHNELKEAYNPVACQSEQPHLSRFEKGSGEYRAESRWLSNKISIKLALAHEKFDNKKYDIIMVGRFDLMLLKPFTFEDFDKDYFYAANWNAPPMAHHNGKNKPQRTNMSPKRANTDKAGLADLWFYASSENMQRFSRLYNKITEYPSSPHKAAWHHVKKFVKPKDIRYKYYRWFDFELYRWKVEGVYK